MLRAIARRARRVTTDSRFAREGEIPRAALTSLARARFASASTLTKLLDGSVFHLDARRGALVGKDALGNEYYENAGYQQGRSRWVRYANLDDYSAANVPREWHGWLHYVNDEPGLPNAVTPVYEDATPTYAGGRSSAGAHAPKGSFAHPRRRDWRRYDAWTPPS